MVVVCLNVVLNGCSENLYCCRCVTFKRDKCKQKTHHGDIICIRIDMVRYVPLPIPTSIPICIKLRIIFIYSHPLKHPTHLIM